MSYFAAFLMFISIAFMGAHPVIGFLCLLTGCVVCLWDGNRKGVAWV